MALHLKAEKKSKKVKTVEAPPKKKLKTRIKSETSDKKEIETTETPDNLEVTPEHVAKCVDAVIKLTEQHIKKESLLSNDYRIFLQINTIKIPTVPWRQLRLKLPHTLAGPMDDVALIVPDITKGIRQDYEKTIDVWEVKLKQNNVTRIKDILPMNKIKTEYSQYEMKRKLGRLYDFFLVDGRIAGHITHCLGSSFSRVAMSPTPIKTFRENLKSEIDNALKKTPLEIHGKGNTHTVHVASSFMMKDVIAENVLAAVEEIKEKYPGGLENIRSILIKSERSLGIPIYYSLKNRNKVKIPNVLPKRPKAYKTVKGELSTVGGEGLMVEVKPSGHVTVINKRRNVKKEEKLETEEKKLEIKKIKPEVKKNKIKVKEEKEKKEKKKKIKVEKK